MELAKKYAIALGIAVLLPMLTYYGVATFESPPDRRAYFAEAPPLKDPYRSEIEQRQQQAAFAERQRAAQAEFEAARRAYARVLFFVAAPLGVVAILLGAVVGIPAIGPGLILGGIATLGMGYQAYWSDLDHALRFVSLLVAFIALVFVAWRQFGGARKAASD